MQTISENTVIKALNQNNYSIAEIETLQGGSNHYVFSAKTITNEDLIIKFPRIRETELEFLDGNRDTLFGGQLSLEREAYLFDLIRDAGLPAPEVFGIYPTDQGKCIVVERHQAVTLWIIWKKIIIH